MKYSRPHLPCHRVILAVDVEGSTNRTNPARIRLRDGLYRVFKAALRAGGITRRHRDKLIDRGDGILALIHPVDEAPKTVLLSVVIPTMSRLLSELTEQRMRLRAVLHAGEVHYDRQGCCGEALDVAFRLLDAPALKATLRNTVAPLALVVSDAIYQSVVRHGYDGIDDHSFEPLVHLEMAGQPHGGWVHLPSVVDRVADQGAGHAVTAASATA